MVDKTLIGDLLFDFTRKHFPLFPVSTWNSLPYLEIGFNSVRGQTRNDISIHCTLLLFEVMYTCVFTGIFCIQKRIGRYFIIQIIK